MVPASKDYSQDCSLEIQITIVAIVTIVTIVTIVKHHIIVIVIHCTGSFPIVIQHSADRDARYHCLMFERLFIRSAKNKCGWQHIEGGQFDQSMYIWTDK